MSTPRGEKKEEGGKKTMVEKKFERPETVEAHHGPLPGMKRRKKEIWVKKNAGYPLNKAKAIYSGGEPPQSCTRTKDGIGGEPKPVRKGDRKKKGLNQKNITEVGGPPGNEFAPEKSQQGERKEKPSKKKRKKKKK